MIHSIIFSLQLVISVKTKVVCKEVISRVAMPEYGESIGTLPLPT